MIRSVEAAAEREKIAQLKRLIASGQYETLEKLEDAVDAFLWAEETKLQPEEQVPRRPK